MNPNTEQELPFTIPELVPDEEPVPVPKLESTNPGVLGFRIPRPTSRRSGGYGGLSSPERSQRRREIEAAMAFIEQKEAERHAEQALADREAQQAQQIRARKLVQALPDDATWRLHRRP